MAVNDVKGLGDKNSSVPTIASARDIGNVAAGYVAGDNGINWVQARAAFDALESRQQGQIATEGQTTQLAQKIGFNLGVVHHRETHPFATNAGDTPYPAH